MVLNGLLFPHLDVYVEYKFRSDDLLNNNWLGRMGHNLMSDNFFPSRGSQCIKLYGFNIYTCIWRSNNDMRILVFTSVSEQIMMVISVVRAFFVKLSDAIG